jgi:trigger factor
MTRQEDCTMHQIVSEDGSRRTVRFTEPAVKTEEHFRKVRREVTKDLDMPGFRPGKVPRTIIDRQYGNMIRAEVADRIRRDMTADLIEEQDWILDDRDPEGSMDLPVEGAEYSFEMTFSLFQTPEPVVDPGLTVTVPIMDLEKVVEETVESFRQRMVSFEKVERPAESGDLVVLETAAAADAGTSREFSVRLGEDGIGPGFDALAVGVVPGDGFAARMERSGDSDPGPGHGFKVVRVMGPVLPELDDEFAVKAAGVATLEELREKVRTGVADRYRQEVVGLKERQVLDSLLGATPFTPPIYMVDNLTSDYLERLGEEDPDKVTREAAREMATRKVQEFLLLRALAIREGLRITPEELEAERSPEESVSSVLDRLRNRKALELLLSGATIVERAPSEDAPAETGEVDDGHADGAWRWVRVPEEQLAAGNGGEE